MCVKASRCSILRDCFSAGAVSQAFVAALIALATSGLAWTEAARGATRP